MSSRPHIDYRAKSHLSDFAYACHRISDLLLACCIPLHFLMLSKSLRGAQGFEASLKLTDVWVFKFGEWALVILLAVHLAGGVRLLIIEFGPWRGLCKGSIQTSILFAILCGLLFLYFAD
ncbi:succinate dehydrogenase [Polynucleobacter necessarius]|uniref:succinate dehydrogenase n=1 Tax=Polynucleobacter necessarius TaxID=576610 RepID=UPI000E09CE54|nr:succinate dehydrogenase [Polynucleobacter necessarius]HAT40082.1 succinate dehydrogenase [Polynucleobacter sp.]